jgi:hypothetical protein
MDIALKMGASRFKNEHPDDWDPMSATQAALDALPQTKPIARRLVEKFDALSLEEKQEFAEWYQQANGIGQGANYAADLAGDAADDGSNRYDNRDG